MRTFFLFFILNSLFRNPLLALIVVGAIFYFSEARYSGRYFNPLKTITKKGVIRDLLSRVSINPHDVGARNDLGRLLIDEGRAPEAREHLEVAITRMDDSPETHYFLGRALIETGNGDKGVEHIRKALELKPGFLYGEPSVALARYFAELGSHGESSVAATDAVRVNTSSVEGWFRLGEAERELGEKAQAARAYEKAEEAFKHLPSYLRMANRTWRSRARKAAKHLG